MVKQHKELKRVLVVEDDPLLALGLEAAFLDAGAGEVVTAGRASHALHELAGRAPHLLVLDLSLIDSDEGFGIAEIALQLFNPPPYIVFSTGSPDRIPAHLRKLGRVFEKPYDLAELARDALAHA
ncbi:MAG: response regulator [Novosphingobium sp.]